MFRSAIWSGSAIGDRFGKRREWSGVRDPLMRAMLVVEDCNSPRDYDTTFENSPRPQKWQISERVFTGQTGSGTNKIAARSHVATQ